MKGGEFENDVKMYGTQTPGQCVLRVIWFENDVKMYGTQTRESTIMCLLRFENDVKMYGTQTREGVETMVKSLRMM